MSDYTVTLRVPGYLQQWMYHDFGNPVELLRDGPESRLLNELLRRTPEEQEEPECLDDMCEPLENQFDAQQEGSTAKDDETGENMVDVLIHIPFFKSKDPRVYNHLTLWGRLAMLESFKTLFKKDLLQSVGKLKNMNCKQVTLIYNWMEEHGIEMDHFDTVKQIYYRNTKKYLKKNNLKV